MKEISLSTTSVEGNLDFGVSHQAKVSSSGADLLLIRTASNLYSEKIGSPIREIATNGLDSVKNHLRAGGKFINGGLKIVPPAKNMQTIVFRDYGTGIPHESVPDTAFTWGETTKAGCAFSVGGYGLGLKSPLAYTDSFQVKSYYDKKVSIWEVFVVGGRAIDIRNYGTFDTDEESGLEVSWPVALSDIEKFEEKIVEQCWAFEPYVMGILRNTRKFSFDQEFKSWREEASYKKSIILNDVVNPDGEVVFEKPAVNIYSLSKSWDGFCFDVNEVNLCPSGQYYYVQGGVNYECKEALKRAHELLNSQLKKVLDSECDSAVVEEIFGIKDFFAGKRVQALIKKILDLKFESAIKVALGVSDLEKNLAVIASDQIMIAVDLSREKIANETVNDYIFSEILKRSLLDFLNGSGNSDFNTVFVGLLDAEFGSLAKSAIALSSNNFSALNDKLAFYEKNINISISEDVRKLTGLLGHSLSLSNLDGIETHRDWLAILAQENQRSKNLVETIESTLHKLGALSKEELGKFKVLQEFGGNSSILEVGNSLYDVLNRIIAFYKKEKIRIDDCKLKVAKFCNKISESYNDVNFLFGVKQVGGKITLNELHTIVKHAYTYENSRIVSDTYTVKDISQSWLADEYKRINLSDKHKDQGCRFSISKDFFDEDKNLLIIGVPIVNRKKKQYEDLDLEDLHSVVLENELATFDDSFNGRYGKSETSFKYKDSEYDSVVFVYTTVKLDNKEAVESFETYLSDIAESLVFSTNGRKKVSILNVYNSTLDIVSKKKSIKKEHDKNKKIALEALFCKKEEVRHEIKKIGFSSGARLATYDLVTGSYKEVFSLDSIEYINEITKLSEILDILKDGDFCLVGVRKESNLNIRDSRIVSRLIGYFNSKGISCFDRSIIFENESVCKELTEKHAWIENFSLQYKRGLLKLKVTSEGYCYGRSSATASSRAGLLRGEAVKVANRKDKKFTSACKDMRFEGFVKLIESEDDSVINSGGIDRIERLIKEDGVLANLAKMSKQKYIHSGKNKFAVQKSNFLVPDNDTRYVLDNLIKTKSALEILKTFSEPLTRMYCDKKSELRVEEFIATVNKDFEYIVDLCEKITKAKKAVTLQFELKSFDVAVQLSNSIGSIALKDQDKAIKYFELLGFSAKNVPISTLIEDFNHIRDCNKSSPVARMLDMSDRELCEAVRCQLGLNEECASSKVADELESYMESVYSKIKNLDEKIEPILNRSFAYDMIAIELVELFKDICKIGKTARVSGDFRFGSLAFESHKKLLLEILNSNNNLLVNMSKCLSVKSKALGNLIEESVINAEN